MFMCVYNTAYSVQHRYKLIIIIAFSRYDDTKLWEMIKFGVSFFWFRFGSVLYKGGAGIIGVKKKLRYLGAKRLGGEVG